MDPLTALRIIFGIASGVASYKSYKKAKKLEKEANQILLQKYGTGGGIPVAYGTRRVAGTVLYANTINNRELFVVYALSIGEIENISNIQIGNRSVADRSVFDHYIQRNSNYYGSTQQEIDNILSNQDPPNKPRMVFNCHLGGADQVADPMLVGCISEWTSAHRLRGIAYIAANFDYDSGGGMFTGFPEITCDVQGKKLYDPRKDSTVTNGSGSHRIDDPSTFEFSDNSALVLLDYLTNTEYGKSLPTSAIDMQSFMDSANKNTVQQTLNYTATIERLSDDDTFRLAKTSANKTVYNALKVGNPITIKIGETTYAEGIVVGKTANSRADSYEDDYRDANAGYEELRENLYIIQLSAGAVTTTIGFTETPASISITTTQDRFPFNGVVDTEETLFDNTKKILGNMRGIFNYLNGVYSLKIEDAESVALSIDDDDILESGITVSIENKEEKYNIVEVEFANAQRGYELDTITYKHTSETEGEDYTYDDGGEELKLTYEMPYITNANIAYQNAKAVLLRSRNSKSISFTGTHKLLYVKVGELISVTNSGLGMSSEQYRITKMTINHDLTVNVEAIIYQSNIYGYVTPPTENIDIPDDLVDSFKVDTPTNVNFVDKDPSTAVQPYLEWDNPTTYPAYEFRVVVKDSSNNVKYDGRTKNTFFNLTGIEVDTGYTAEVRSLNTNYVESPPATYNFNNSVPPVQNGDLGDSSVTDAKVADISADKIDTGVLNLGTESGMAVRQAKAGYTDTTTGFWLGNDSGTPKFNIGTSSSYFKFDGSSVDIAGDLTATNLTIDANATINGTLDASVIRLDGQDLSTLIGFGATSPNASGDYFNFTGKVDFSDDVVFDDFATFYNSVTFSDGWQGQGIFDIDQGALEFGSYTPSSTTNRLYNVSGTLYWNGSQVGVGAVNSVTNMVDNRVITASGSNSINGEANLTFDGTTLNVTGDQVITGNLTVQGTTTTIDTTNLDVKDKNITLNYGTGDTSANANGAGITIQDAVSATEDATILWDTTNDRFDFSHGITLPDNGKAIFGAGSDLQIYHDGTHSYIDDAGTGDLRIKTNFFRVRNTGDTYNMIIADQSGAVTLYNNGNTKLATTSTGIDVTGQGKFTDLTNGGLVHARGLDASLFLDVTSGNNAKIYYDSGDLEFKATNPTAVDSSVSMKIAQNRDISFYEDTGTTAKLFWDASTERLGVGTVSPSYLLDIESSSTGNITLAQFKTNESTYNGLLIAANNNAGWIGNGTLVADEGILFQDTSSAMRFYTASSEAMRIDSSQNLLVGQTVQSPNTVGISLNNNGNISAKRDGGIVALFNRATSDGEIISIRKDDTTVGSIGTEGGNLYIDGNPATGKTGIEFLGSAWFPRNDGANSDGAVDLGDATNRFKDLYLSGTANFGSLSDGTITITGFVDEDDMSSNSATLLPTQQSVKAYVDSQVSGVDTLAEILAIGNTTGGTDIAVSTGDDITFVDNAKAIFGTGSDFEIYHDQDGPSYIRDKGSSDLVFTSNGSGFVFKNDGETETLANMQLNGAVTLYYDNSPKLATTSGGVTVSGELDTTGNIAINKDVAKLTINNNTANTQASIDIKNTSLYARYILDNDDLFRIYNQTSGFDTFAVKSNGDLYMGSTKWLDLSRNLTNIGTISSGGITSSGDIQSDKFKGNTYSSNSFLDFDDDSGVLDADNTTTLASISAMHFIIDTNANGSADKFYWLKDNVSPLSATTLMDLDKNANLVLRNGTVTGQSGGFFGGDLEVYNSSDLIIGTGGTFKFGTTVIVDASRNLTNIGTISSGAISTSANLDMNANSIIDIEQLNGTGGSGWLDFNMDTDNIYPTGTTDNITVLGSITHHVFVGDSNDNGTGGNFYWGYGVNNAESGTFTETMALTRAGDLTVQGNIISETSTGNNGIKVITGNNAEGFIIFGDAQDNSMGGMSYNNSSNSLDIDCNNGVALSFNSSRNATFSNDVDISGDLDVTGTISTTSFSADSLSTDTLTTDDVIYQSGSTNVATKGMRTATTTATTETAVVSISTGFTSVKFLVQITNTTNPAYHVTEITLLNDGTNQYISEYGTILTGSALATFDADKTATNLRLLATPTTTDTLEFKIMYNAIYS